MSPPINSQAWRSSSSAISERVQPGLTVLHRNGRSPLLCVLWIWGEQETGSVASEAGVTKGTLTGVVRTLTGRKLLIRTVQKDDRRRVDIRLSRNGEKLIAKIYPLFNQEEHSVMSGLSVTEQKELARLLQKVNAHMHEETL